MDFLAPRQSVLQPSRGGVDLRLRLGALLAPPLPSACLEFAGLLAAVRAKRGAIASGLTEVLFGSVHDAAELKVDENPMSFIFSPASVAAAPHAQFTCSRGLNEEVHFEVVGLQEQPPTGPPSVPRIGRSYGDAWFNALHLQAEPGTNEMQITLAVGSHAEFVPMALELLAEIVSSLGFVSSGCSDIDDLGNAYRTSFPHLATHFAKFVDFTAVEIAMEEVEARSSQFTFHFPLDYVALEQHYERLADLLRHFDKVHARACHPETGADLMELLLEGDVVRVTFMVQDGKLCWQSTPCEPVTWTSGGTFTYNLAVDSNMKLLGLSFPSLPFPHLQFKCQLSRNLDGQGGSLYMTCIDVGELILENVASFVFDVPRFRQLLLERFHLEIVHRPAEMSEDGWLLAGFSRMPFPVVGVAQAFAQVFRKFITRQWQEMTLLAAVQDFLAALSLDATALSCSSKQPQRRDVRQSFGLF